MSDVDIVCAVILGAMIVVASLIAYRQAEVLHQHDCDRSECGSFVCRDCGRRVGWCYGGEGPDPCADDDQCDDCWCDSRNPCGEDHTPWS